MGIDQAAGVGRPIVAASSNCIFAGLLNTSSLSHTETNDRSRKIKRQWSNANNSIVVGIQIESHIFFE